MSIPQITFPVPQESVAEEAKKLRNHITGLNADIRVTSEMLRALMAMCVHPHKRDNRCPDCGADWND